MLEVHETITGHSRIDFDKVKIRRAMRKIGADVRKESRRMVSRQAVAITIKNYGSFQALNYGWVPSRPGEYPNMRSGALRRSIAARVSKPGFLVRIAPDKTPEMGRHYYPAFLRYGTSRGIAPRENYMIDALEAKRESVRATLRDALMDSLKPR